ncbi:UDP-glucose 4-epimerase GalE [Vreelandella sp. TE19]
MNVLLVGGLGYIGSHMWKVLARSGHKVTVIDNLSTGNVNSAKSRTYINCDLLDQHKLNLIFESQVDIFDIVMHFAAKSLVGESMSSPAKYYRNNVVGTLNLLDCMRTHGVKNIIFSSTAATFGEPLYLPIDENHQQTPINPYGTSKLIVEGLLKDYSNAYGVNSISLRYFNACGADPENEIGEQHDPETHLIPLVLQAASGRKENICVFGRDYNTPDGTCIRDYVHVMDLCQAHELAATALVSGRKKGASAYNLGNGDGFSVQEVIETARAIVAEDDKEIFVVDKPRREGDPARLVADATMAKIEIGWKPSLTDLETIIRHAWSWEKNLAGL